MTSLSIRIRRKSATSLHSLFGDRNEKIDEPFVVDHDAPPVPPAPAKIWAAPIPAQYLENPVRACTVETSIECKAKTKSQIQKEKGFRAKSLGKKEAGQGGAGLPDVVLRRIFEFLVLPASASPLTGISSASGGPNTAADANRTTRDKNGPTIRALGRCTLASRRFNALASPILYRALTYHDGHRFDPFLDMQSSSLRSARHRLARWFSSSSASSSIDCCTRKARLLAQTKSLTVSYHWHQWCSPRPVFPLLPNLQVLCIQLDAQSRDNGLHVDRKDAPKCCNMLQNIRAETVVLDGVSLWSTKSVWEHLPVELGRGAKRVVYVLSSARPPSRGVKDNGVRGLALHIAKQPIFLQRQGNEGRRKKSSTPAQEVKQEIVLVFKTDHGKRFELDCDGKEPNGISQKEGLKDWGWVGGLIDELEQVLRGRHVRLTVVNGDSLPHDLNTTRPGGLSVARLPLKEVFEENLEVQVEWLSMREYVLHHIREGEADWSDVGIWASASAPAGKISGEAYYEYAEAPSVSDGRISIGRMQDQVGLVQDRLEVTYVDGKSKRAVRFG